MLDLISAAANSFASAAKSAVNIRGAIVSTANLLDDREIDKLKKSIRIVYFFKDDVRSDLDALLTKSSNKKMIAESIKARLAETDDAVSEALKVMTKSSVATNLNLNIEEVTAIREIANLRSGIRQHLRNLISVVETGLLPKGTEASIKRIRTQIATICKEVEKIESILQGKGLRRVKV